MADFSAVMKEDLSWNLQQLRGRILEACEKYDRDADEITIVAVTKTHPAAVIRMAVAAGLHNIGESRVQEAEAKITEIGPIARYHMVGHLQSNKARKAAELFDVIQSVDSLKLAKELDKYAGEFDRTIECLIQVNCSGEEQKFGVDPEKTIDLVKTVHAMENIDVTGLMTIGPLTDDDEKMREAFRLCNDLFKQAQDIVGDDFEELSMGMSDDLGLAIAEGSTMIRVGTALFGPRQTRE